MIDGGRVVVSGLGVVSPFGIGTARFWEALVAGRSAIDVIRRFDAGAEAPRLAAEVPDFPAREFLPPTLVRRMDRLSRMIGVAAMLAATDAGLGAGKGTTDDLGVVVGSALGNISESAQFLDRVFTKGPSLANPMLFPNLVMNAPASQVSMALLWRGPNLTVTAGEVSGEAALELAIDLVRRGRARAVLVAAGEELSEVVFRSLRDFRYLSPRRRGRERSCPFDRDANGPVLGEGAAAIVVETLESARRRGARVRAAIERLARFHVPAASPHGWPTIDAARAADAPRPTAAADVAFSGADSSPERDRLEISLLERMVGNARPVYSLCGALGSHASQGLSTIVAAVLTLAERRLPPLLGIEQPIPSTMTLPTTSLEGAWSRALVLGLARGGAGALVELERVAEVS